MRSLVVALAALAALAATSPTSGGTAACAPNLANRLSGGAVASADAVVRLLAGGEVQAWMVERPVPILFGYENAESLYDKL